MIRINLFKPEKKEIRRAPDAPSPQFKEKKSQPLFGLIFLLLIVVVIAGYLWQRKTFIEEQDLLEKAQVEKRELQDVLVKLDQLEQQKTILERKMNLINQLKARQGIAVKIMDELSKQIPDWVWLTEVSYNGQSVKLKGKAFSNNLIADYIYNLEESPYFSGVNLISSTQRRVKNNEYLEFSMNANFVPPPTFSDSLDQTPQEENK